MAPSTQAGACLVMGDSIALGTAQHAPQCLALAKVGIGSSGWLQRYGHYLAQMPVLDTVVISLGANDSDALRTERHLLEVRRLISAQKVIWIVPSDSSPVKSTVDMVVKKFGDQWVTRPEKFKTPDGIHMTAAGYKVMARLVLD